MSLRQPEIACAYALLKWLPCLFIVFSLALSQKQRFGYRNNGELLFKGRSQNLLCFSFVIRLQNFSSSRGLLFLVLSFLLKTYLPP